MNQSPLIGVLGATGAVGQVAVRRLCSEGLRVRPAGRNRDALAALAASVATAQVPHAFTLDDASALSAFCEGCDVVINATGPSYRWAREVQATLRRQGIDGIDVAGDDRLGAPPSLAPTRPSPSLTVLGAGQAPGLSGLLPRLLLRQAGPSGAGDRQVSSQAGGIEFFTATSALEFAMSMEQGHGQPLALWRDGAVRRQEALPRRIALAGRAPVQTLAYLPNDLERLAREASLTSLCHEHLIAGPAILGLLAQGFEGSVDTLAEQLRHAAAADAAGQAPWQLMRAQLKQGERRWRVELAASSGYALTGEVAAWAAQQLAQRRRHANQGPSVRWFDAWADPMACWNALCERGVFDQGWLFSYADASRIAATTQGSV